MIIKVPTNKTSAHLIDSGYLKEVKPKQARSKGQTTYELKIKANLAMFLKENNIQDILDQSKDAQAAHILLAMLNVFLQEKNQNEIT